MELLIIIIICAVTMGIIMFIDKKVNKKIEEKELLLKSEQIKKENSKYINELSSFTNLLINKKIIKSDSKMEFIQEMAFRDYERKKQNCKTKNEL